MDLLCLRQVPTTSLHGVQRWTKGWLTDEIVINDPVAPTNLYPNSGDVCDAVAGMGVQFLVRTRIRSMDLIPPSPPLFDQPITLLNQQRSKLDYLTPYPKELLSTRTT